MKTKQLYSNTWVPVGAYELHQCCFCGAEHEVFIRWNKRKKILEERWKPLTTQKPRKSRDHKSVR